MANRLSVRLPAELLESFSDYCKANDLTQSQAVRVALERLLRRPPTAKEVEAAKVETGAAAWRGRE